MNNLELEPWEVPIGVDVPLVAPADAQVESPVGMLLLRVVRIAPRRFVIFARREEENFLLVQVERWQSLKPAIWKTRPTPQKLVLIAARVGNRQSYKHGAFELAPFMVVRDEVTGISTNALARVISWNHWATGVWVSEDLDLPIYFLFPHRDDTRRSLEKSLESSITDVRVAWEWKHMEERERFAHFESSQTRLVEMQQVALWAMKSTLFSWEQLEFVRLTAKMGIITISLISGDKYFISPTSERHFLQSWPRMLATIFTPQDSLILRFNRNGNQGESSDLDLKIYSPTHHEQLEARLHLRDWLQQNAPDRLDLLLD